MNRLKFSSMWRFAFCLTLLFLMSSVASAATIDFQVLLDVDNKANTGCTVGGMPGVEQVITTSVTTTDTAGSVTTMSRRVCNGNTLGAPLDIDTSGWPIGFNPNSGQMVVESRVPYAVLGNGPFLMRIGFTATTGSTTSSVLTKPNGDPILFPPGAQGKRRSAVPGNLEERIFALDGQTKDWGMIPPLGNNSAPGQQVFRLSQVYGFGDGEFFWFRADANLSKNPPPQANDDAYSVRQGQAIVIVAPGVLGNDVSPSGAPLTASIVTNPTHGVVTLNSSGAFTYVNDGNFNATDFFEYRASDGAQTSNTAKVLITIIPNGIPVAVNDTYNVTHGGTLTVPAPGVLSNDNDPDGDPLSAIGLSTPANGTLSFNTNGGFVYTHNGSNTLSDSFQYAATDQISQSAPATVTITVGPDTPPTAVNDAYGVAEGGTLNVTAPGLFANDSDPDTPQSLWVMQVVTPPTNGTLTPGTGGAFTYVHNGSETTTDSFVYRVNDGIANSNNATVTITVTPVNDAPVANNDAYNTNEDTPLNVAVPPGLLANDSDAETNPMTAALVANATNGNAVVNPSGTFTYTPNANFNGTDTFTYNVTDSGLAVSNTATVTITVAAVNDPPSFTAGPTVTVNEDSGAYSAGWATAISPGPADESAQTVSFNVSNNNNALFSVQPSISPTGVLTFTPALNANGTATVTVSLTDSGSNIAPNVNTSAPQNFTINVTAVNDAPSFTKGLDQTVAEDSGLQTVNGWATAISPGPADEAGQTLTFNVSNDNNALFSGQPAVSPAGDLTYTPAPNANGVATVTVTLSDNGSNVAPNVNTSAPQTFTITITAVNDAPVNTVPIAQNINEDVPLVFSTGNANAISVADVDAGTAPFRATLTGTNGTVTAATGSGAVLTGDGTATLIIDGTLAQVNVALNGLTFTPTLNYNGAASLQIVSSDLGATGSGGTLTDTDSVTINIAAVNDAPVFTAGPNPVTVNEDSGAYSNGWATAIGPGGGADESAQTVSFNVSNDNNSLFTGGGQPAISPTGVLTFTPAADASGSATVTVSLTDSGSGVLPNVNTSASVQFTITVTAVNDAPVVTTTGGTTAFVEDAGAVAIDSGITVTDVDSPTLASATVTITNLLDAGQEVLSAPTLLGSATANYVAPTLTITGSATVAEYQTMLAAVTYINNSNNPTTTNRVIAFQVNDGAGVNNLSNVANKTVSVTAVNDAPVVTTTGGTTGFTEDGGAVTVDSGVTVTDVDTATIASATVTITNLLDAGQEVLSAPTLLGGATANYVAPTLTISGTTTLANYQAMLAAVTYNNTSNNPNTTTRVLDFQVNDGTSNSNIASKSVSITPVNDAPVVTTTGGTTAFVEDAGAVAVDSGITVTDIDSANLSSATVTITNTLDAGFEVLAAPTLLGAATANYVAPTLTISGAATVAEYQTMLAAVTYNNTSNNPTTTNRVLNFQVDDGAGVNNLSNVASKTVSVAATNDAPVVTTTGGTTAFTEDGGAVVVDSGVTVTDVDNATIASATVTITNLLDAGQEVLAAPTLLGGAVANYVAPTLTISGTTTLANYQAMLAAVTYNNTSNNPNTTNRVIAFVANDGTTNSAAANKTVSITPVNDAPVVTTSGGTTAFVEDAGAVAVDGALTVTDIDSATLSSATVTISNLLDAGQEVLNAPTLLGSATANYAAPTLTISGSATVAEYQTMLRAVTYNNTSNNPNTTNRVLNFQVNDGGGVNNLSNVANKTVSVAATNDAPVVTTSGGTTSFTEAAGAVTIDSGVTVTDVDSATIASATVTISNLLDAGQETLAAPTLLGGATANYVAPTLTISGTTSIANYQAMLAAVTYNNASNAPNPTTRTINFQVNDGAANSNVAAKSVSITSVNSQPVVTTTGGTTAFVEDGAAVAIDGGLTVTDPDTATIASATVTISNLLDAGLETLNAPTLLGGATANYVAPTLTISGTTTLANYQSMLRAVTYFNASNTPNTTNRVINFQVDDGQGSNNLSNVASKTVSVTPTNDAPVIATSGGTTSFTEGAGAVVVDSGVTVSDVDSPTMASATITISNLLDAGQETLAAPTLLGGATANYIAPTLTISGVTSVANYQAMLAAVTYNNASNNPNTTTRTINFRVNDGAGVNNLSNIASKSVSVTSVNSAPVVTTSGGTTAFVEDGGAVAVDGALTVTDADSANLTQATITITNLQDAGLETLNAPTLLGGATANYVAPTLTISGSTTVANYQTMLRAVTYNNASNTPNTTTRTVAFQVTDGTDPSNVANKSVSVAATNDAPIVTTTGGNTSFTEDGGAVTIDSGVTVTDVDSATIASATVTITNLLDAGQEVLAAPTLLGGATANYIAPTLTITGVTSLANYQTMLAAVTYNNTSQGPNTTTRVIAFVANDGTNNSAAANKNVTVTGVNDAPVVTTTGGTTAFTEDGGAVAIDGGLTVTDVDSANLSSATITISNLQNAGVEVLAAPTLLGGATANYVAPTLTISGVTTVANYQTMLRAVTYNNTSQDPNTTTRVINFQVNDGAGVNNLSNTASKNVSVTSVNDKPTPNAVGPFTVQAGMTVSFPAATLGGTDVEAGTTVTVDTTPGTVTNGTVTLNANGSFSFTATPASAGSTASFQYNVCDNGNPGPGTCSTTPVTVTLNVNGPAIYFVTTAGAGTTCSQPAPCTLATAVAQIGANTNRKIFIMDNGTYNTAVPLNSQGWLIGQGVTTGFADFDAVFSINPASVSPGTLAARPAINQPRPTIQQTVSLNASTAVRGVNITTTTVVAMNDAQAGTFASPVVNDTNLSATGFAALDLSTITAASLTFGSVSGNGGANAILINNVAGGITVNGGTLQATTAAAVNISASGSLTTTLSSVTFLNTCTIGIGGTTFGALSVSGVTLAAAQSAMQLTTGAVTGTFTSVTCAGGGNQTVVLLSGVTGNFTVSGGALNDAGAANTVFNVAGGTATIVWNGTISQTGNAAPMVDITTTNTGNITFGGNLTASQGTGMQFNDADGTYTVSGALNGFTAGSGININNGSSGNFSFNSNTTVTNGLVGANTACLVINGSSPTTFTYSGNLTKNGTANGRLVDLDTIAATANPITFNTGTLSTSSTGATSTGVRINDVDKAVNFSGTLTLDNGDSGVDITGGSIGALTFNSSTSIGATTGATGIAFDVNNGSVATNITYNGTIRSTASRPVSIQNCGNGTAISFTGNVTSTSNGILMATTTGTAGSPSSVTFSGASKSLSIGANTGVTWTGTASPNNFVTLTFSNGGLVITRTTGAGINATVGGTLVITKNAGAANTIGNNNSSAAGNGTGLLVQNVTIGTGGLVFESINQNGGANGVFLQNTGSTAALQVTGNTAGFCGGDTAANAGPPARIQSQAPATADCTGGQIQNTQGADGGTGGTAIYLDNTNSPSFTRVRLTTNNNWAVRGNNVTGFTLQSSLIDGTSGNNNATDDGGIYFTGLFSSASIANVSISGALEDSIRVVNTNGTLNRLVIDKCQVASNDTASGNDSINVESSGTAIVNWTVQNSLLTGAKGDLINANNLTGSTMDVIVTGNAISNNHPSIVAAGGGTTFVGTGTMTYSITGNSFRDAVGNALMVNSSGDASPGTQQGVVSGTIDNNDIGVTAVNNSGSTSASGIDIESNGGGDHFATINNNRVRQYNNHGILLGFVDDQGKTANIRMKVTNNTINTPGTINTDFNGFHLNNGATSGPPAPGDDFTTCLHLSGNNWTGGGKGVTNPNNQEFRLRQRIITTVQLPGYLGANNDNAAVATFIRGQNTGTAGNGAASNTVGTGGGGFVNTPGSAICVTP